jgi:hypothetical protein
MTRLTPLHSSLIALSLVGCAESETKEVDRSAIQFVLTGDADEIKNSVDEFLMVVDHEVEYDVDTTRIQTEWMDLRDYDNDGKIELILTVDLDRSNDELPSVELRPGANTSPFTVTMHGWDSDIEMVRSDIIGPLEFTDVVQEIEVGLALLDTPITPCLNGEDDDGDGYIDANDPDCAEEGIREEGYGDTECNDGIDNDSDGLLDSEDTECSDASGEYEQVPECADGIDNDGDGWTDAYNSETGTTEDPDCTEWTNETTENGTDEDYGCNDGIDNDEDGLTDRDDDDCTHPADEEVTEPPPDPQCADTIDNDEDGYIDLEDPDCADYVEDGEDIAESGYGSTECNDGIDNDEDGDIDVDDTACSEAIDDTETNLCGDGEDNDGDGWTDLEDPDCDGDIDIDDEGSFADISECSDGIDNDSDGDIDALDSDCIDATDDLEGTYCEDGEDNDGDGWTDDEDPDCIEGGTDETGYGLTQCNDGLDNDGDDLIDRADTGCDGP